MTKINYFLSANFQANTTDISWQKVVFLVIQNYAQRFLSWMAFSAKLALCEDLVYLVSIQFETILIPM